jgi:putative ABC transport system permease protein
LFVPELTEGRVLHPEDGRAMLLNQKIAREMGVGIGDQINLEIGPWGESSWTVVGLVFDLGGRDQNTAFVYLDELNHVLNLTGRGSIAQVKTNGSTAVMQKAVERDLIDFLEAEGVTVSFTDTALENKEMASAQFQVLINVLLVMTVLMGAVGSMGLSGTLSINVIERRREIGVMRAVGASSRDVGVVFSGEGLMLGLISWLFAVPLGLGLGPIFLQAVGAALDFPAEYTPSFGAVWLWLGIVLVLSLAASWLPARRATQISVNESLAYE